MAWSPDSDHILCGVYKRATVQVFSVSDSTWTCTIAEGPAGIVTARWAPSGQHILLTSDFQVRLSVWSLVDQKCKYLRGPKHDKAGCAFSPDGTLLAVAGVSQLPQIISFFLTNTGCPLQIAGSLQTAAAAGGNGGGVSQLPQLLPQNKCSSSSTVVPCTNSSCCWQWAG